METKKIYECMFIVDLTDGETAVKATVDKFKALIEDNAELINFATWGKRRLAYPINDMNDGYYCVADFKAAGTFPAEFERLLNIDEKIMRSLIVRLEKEPVVKETVEAPVEEAVVEEAVAEETVAEEVPAAEEAVAE